MRRDITIILSLLAFAAAAIIGIQDGGSITAMAASSNGTSYDVDLCIREGYADVPGASYNFVGSIGCPLPSEFNVSLDPTAGIAGKGDVRSINVSVNVSGNASASLVGLTAGGLPAGTTAAFSPASCTPNCYSNMTINTSLLTPSGSHNVSVNGTSGSTVKTAYYNLTVLASGVPATCGAPTTCDYGETQANCASDCNTTAGISPSTITPGEIVTVTVEFRDFRYLAGGKVKIVLVINPEGTTWNAANGCFFGGVKLGPTSGNGATAWPSGTTSEDGHFRISTSCTVPGTTSAGVHTLVATPTIF